jgi:hypothetical protein
MPNNLLVPIPAAALLTVALLAAAGCATTEADPDLLLEADDAIVLAERAGARDHAPLELDQALELRQQAAQAVADDEPLEAARLVERAALQARLAIVRAEAGRARAELQDKREGLDRLRAELREAFGEAIEIHDGETGR